MTSPCALDTAALQQNRHYKALTRAERGLFRDLLDQVWQRCEAASAPSDIAALAAWVEEDQAVLAALLDKLCAPRGGLIQRHPHPQTGVFVYTFAALIAPEKSLRETQAQLARRHARGGQRIERSTLARVSQLIGEEPEILYLPPAERDCARYSGWLPTSRFHQSGEAIPVSGALARSLGEEFPGVSLGVEMDNLFSWLSRNPERRPPAGGMPRLIRKWLTVASGGAAAGAPSTQAVEARLRELLEAGEQGVARQVASA
ncbi:hypothetical protein J2T57_001279 [Natronocella acetinitrilica]|uniref:Uncharacterized protein n=1 Tax=Natronocella acetinitrilica TaxID=414046 RepID=A0AAE3G2F5_9GAMM|nr:hypothetical protein [Natronocella acetinitrilica]MCP1674177.1 hypothetical protein [Natronocella acetinitrilica]